jgi:cytochrome c2
VPQTMRAKESCWAPRCRAFSFSSVHSVLILLSLAAPALAQQRDAGERAFQKCYSCHSVDRAEKELSGPNLAGVVGRRAAALANFAYSPAMKKAGADGLVWSEEALERYLADPLEMIPETTMSFPGVKNAAERRTIIEYLRRFR